MHKLTLYYTDWQCPIQFYESEELAEFDQYEYDGEIVSLEFISESPIVPPKQVETKESYFVYMINVLDKGDTEEEDKITKFIKQFFPNGLPTFRVETESIADKGMFKHSSWNKVFVGNKYITKILTDTKYSGETFEKELNNFK